MCNLPNHCLRFVFVVVVVFSFPCCGGREQFVFSACVASGLNPSSAVCTCGGVNMEELI